MSWSEVFKINKNMKRALNEQIRDIKCLPMRVFTANGTYTPEKTGLYKVICVGAGATGTVRSNVSPFYVCGGGGGGVAIKTLRLLSSQSYSITVSTTASFSNVLSATAGSTGGYNSTIGTHNAAGGTASGGDYNFSGETVPYKEGKDNIVNGGSVGVNITELSRNYVFTGNSGVRLIQGDCLLKYGGGGAAAYDINNLVSTAPGFPACVIIIPIEMED